MEKFGLQFIQQQYNQSVSTIVRETLEQIVGGQPTVDDYRKVKLIEMFNDGSRYMYYSNDEIGYIKESLVESDGAEKLLVEFIPNSNSESLSRFEIPSEMPTYQG